MKNGKKRNMILAICTLVLCMVMGIGFLVFAENSKTVYHIESDGETGIYSVAYSYTEMMECRATGDNKENTAPKAATGYEDYAFAGWYTDQNCTSESALSADDISAIDSTADDFDKNAEKYYAKFVSKDVLDVKTQIHVNTDSTSDNATLRFVTTVDCTDYQKVGFKLVYNTDKQDDKTKITKKKSTTTVYKKLYYVDNDSKTVMECEPKDYFHGVSKYFAALNLTNVPQDCFENGIAVEPYWVTYDGTTVCGRSYDGNSNPEKSVKQTMPSVCEALVTDSEGNTAYYTTLEKAFTVDTETGAEGSTTDTDSNTYLTEGCTVTLIQDSIEIETRVNVYADNITLTNEKGRDVTVSREYSTKYIDNLAGTFKVIGDITTTEDKVTGSLTFDGQEATGGYGWIESDETANQTLVLTNITLKNNRAARTGGAVRAKGSATITNCTFENNILSETSAGDVTKGAAIYYAGSNTTKLTVTGSTFNSNSTRVSTEGKKAGDGGAIYINAGVVAIENSKFDSNASTGANGGGAIYINAGAVTLNNCTFTSNEATGNGGAIYVYNATSITVTNSVFASNKAKHGGAIRLNNTVKGNVEISDCIFDTNTLTAGNGGAINVQTDTTVAIKDSYFKKNESYTKKSGGAIYSTSDQTSIDGCTFEGNTCNGGTGAAVRYGSKNKVTCTNITLINQNEAGLSSENSAASLITQTTTSGANSGVSNIIDCDEGYTMSLLTNMDKNAFDAYCTRLVTAGYSLQSENTMNESDTNRNIARTYYSTTTRYMIHTYWVEYSQEVRAISAQVDEKVAALSGLDTTTSTETCDTIFHQLEALHPVTVTSDSSSIATSDGGMGYIIRLKDGRFIIIDGGSTDNAEEIYTFLNDNASDKNNIIIATWFITHAHGDHSGAFRQFVATYMDSNSAGYKSGISIESIMYNPCNTTEQTENTELIDTEITTVITNYLADATVYKPLTGQIYTFAGTSIEILYTMSDFLPNTVNYADDDDTDKGMDYNVQSVVSIIDIDNTQDRSDRIFMMADTTAFACNEMMKRYGAYMQCDYVQIAHHGLNEITDSTSSRRHGATKAIYECIIKRNFTIALWPSSVERYADRTKSTVAVNYWLVTEGGLKAIWIAERSSDNDTTYLGSDNTLVVHDNTVTFSNQTD